MIKYPINIFLIKGSLKPFALFLLIILFSTCIDPYNPNIKGSTSMLVVDGLLTNENKSYTVKLSRSVQTQNEDPTMVTGAEIAIIDQDNVQHNLTEKSAGIYKTDSLEFIATEGRSYTLYIKSAEGNEYKSDPCIMYPAQPIDSIYFGKDQEIPASHSEILEGIRIYIDAKNQGGQKYFRWDYDEWWKFSVPYPKLYNYIDQDNIPEVDIIKQVCYAYNGSSDIIIRSTEGSQSSNIEKLPMLFVASDQSDRLLIQYCIDIKQMSLSHEEFQFWEQLKEINDEGGDIFNKQPFAVIGNIHGVTKTDETVLGYFQVSAVSEKRLYILPDQLKDLNLPMYSYDCEQVTIGPSDYPSSQNPSQAITFDKIYASYTSTGFIFISPVYDIRFNLQKLVFTKPSCALCTSRGNLSKPYFWTDLDSPLTKK